MNRFSSLWMSKYAARLCCVAVLLLVAPSAFAAITVTSNGDGPATPANCPGANCTLRDAIAAAAAGETISIAFGGTITLAGAELLIDKNLTIQGPGANVLTITGNNLSRVFSIDDATVTIAGLTITGGNGDGADDPGEGGGIYANRGVLNLTNCHLTGNTGNNGGGVYFVRGAGTFTGCTFSNNTANDEGGGIWYRGDDTTLTLVNCTVSGNRSNGFGGGIVNFAFCGDSTMQVNNSTIANNTALAMMPPGGGGITSSAEGGECGGEEAIVILRSSIVANNSLPNLGAFGTAGAVGNILSQGFNLTDDNGSGFLNQPTDILNTNPLLAALGNYGGPTPTMLLPNNSPAIDKGNSFGLIIEQRGLARTFNFPAIANAGDGTDIGAVEIEAPGLFQVADPALCLEPGGLAAAIVTITNLTGATQTVNHTATLPAGLTAIAGTCTSDVPGPCVIAPNGGSVSWNGMLLNGQTLNLTYRARIAPNVPVGTQLVINNTVTIGAQAANFVGIVAVNCPPILAARVSDQKPGSLLVFPYYTSTIGGASDTRMTISNISNAAGTLANQTYVHLFFIDGTTCNQADLFLCLTPNASFSFKASEYDPGTTGYVIAVAVNAQGVPIQRNVLIGNAFVRTPQLADNYGAESFWANTPGVAVVNGNTATLFFDQAGYDEVPRQFAVEIQSPLNAPGQQIVTAGLSGDLITGQITGAAQIGTGQAFNEKEVFASFNNWLLGTCQARATIATNSPRVPNGLNNLIKTGQAGSLKFNVGGAVGLLLTPRGGAWTGIRTLHKTQTTSTTLTIPIFPPVC